MNWLKKKPFTVQMAFDQAWTFILLPMLKWFHIDRYADYVLVGSVYRVNKHSLSSAAIRVFHNNLSNITFVWYRGLWFSYVNTWNNWLKQSVEQVYIRERLLSLNRYYWETTPNVVVPRGNRTIQIEKPALSALEHGGSQKILPQVFSQ